MNSIESSKGDHLNTSSMSGDVTPNIDYGPINGSFNSIKVLFKSLTFLLGNKDYHIQMNARFRKLDADNLDLKIKNNQKYRNVEY